MKWTPQKAMARHSFVLGGHVGQLVAVAAEVGQGDHGVLLVVMAENQQPRAHLAPHPLDARGELVVFQRFVGGRSRVGMAGV